jgi:Bacterial proteasome activator
MANGGRQSDGLDGPVPASRVVVALGPAGPGKTCRVESPERLLRLWALLNAAGEELRPQDLPPAARAWLQRRLTAVAAELSRCVSADLAAELDHLWQPGAEVPDAGELRIEYALLLGWLSGLVIGMLEQLEASAPPRRHTVAVPVALTGVSAGAGQSPGTDQAVTAQFHPPAVSLYVGGRPALGAIDGWHGECGRSRTGARG